METNGLIISEHGFLEKYTGNDDITEIDIGDDVSDIFHGVFEHCSNLLSINVSPSNKYLSSYNGLVYNKEQTTLLLCPSGIKGTVTIPHGVTKIRQGAFKYCEDLAEINLPDSVSKIDDFSFYYELTSITIPKSLKMIWPFTFWTCQITNIIFNGTKREWFEIPKLKSRNILFNAYLDKKERVPYYTWDFSFPSYTIHCTDGDIQKSKYSFSDFIIDKGVLKKVHCSFNTKSSFEHIEIPNTVTRIGKGVFCCFSDLQSVTIPNSVKIIDKAAFSGCISLKNIFYEGTVEQWKTIHKERKGFSYFLLIKYIFLSEKSGENPKITEWLSDSWNSLCCRYTVQCSDGEIKDIEDISYNDFIIKKGVLKKYNGEWQALKNIIIPDGVTKIGKKVFKFCEDLTSVTLPLSVTQIEKKVFRGSSKLHDIFYSGTINQWNLIKKKSGHNYDWYGGCDKYTIHCIDGNINN